ncbi:hypothetical protein KSF_001320 [Reticulibacter mediterranei]|uniref:Uncharacterized protein n=1 Tax=Reticulibacter mediterranei TaxID=2778369 RepID=A0A8J3MWQ0_9CHLR|nr:hypothetical protein KSF_001320 [Reticulibacter mediterranei]
MTASAAASNADQAQSFLYMHCGVGVLHTFLQRGRQTRPRTIREIHLEKQGRQEMDEQAWQNKSGEILMEIKE